MDSAVENNFSKSMSASLMPVRFCDMNDASEYKKDESVIRIPFKFMPILTCDLAKQLGMDPESKKTRRKSDKKERKSNDKRLGTSMKPNKKDLRKTTYVKPLVKLSIISSQKDLLQQSLTSINMKNFKQTPRVFDKSKKNIEIYKIVINNQNPLILKNTNSTVKSPKKSLLPKRVNKNETINKKDCRSEDKNKSIANNRPIRSTNYFDPLKSTRLSFLPKKINKNELDKKNCSSGHKNESILNSLNLIFSNKLDEFYNKIDSRLNEHDSKFDVIIKKLDKLEINNECKNSKMTASVKKQNEFELLESKFNNECSLLDELSLSDVDSSPTVVKDIMWLINDKEEQQETKANKFLSTSSVVAGNPKKSVTFLSKSQSELDPVDKYNEIRNNFKFLCTPKKTKTIANLMTPSVKNSQNKMISRKVQEQLLMLD